MHVILIRSISLKLVVACVAANQCGNVDDGDIMIIVVMMMMMIIMMTVIEVKLTFHSSQDKLQEDEDVQAASEASILTQYQKDAQSFAEPQTTVLG